MEAAEPGDTVLITAHDERGRNGIVERELIERTLRSRPAVELAPTIKFQQIVPMAN